MDKAKAKLILESYRPQDADDPVFEEALRLAASDPELAAWFEESQRFDAVMSAKFQEIPVPTDLRNHILLGRNNARTIIPFPQRKVPLFIGAIAACILAGLVVWHALTPRSSSLDALASQAISYTGSMPSLQFVCFDPKEVANWINHQPGSAKVGLQLPMPDASMRMKMIGSSMTQWNGRPVVMICLQNGKRMAMLYILHASDLDSIKNGDDQMVQKSDWVVHATDKDGQVRLLATKGGPDDLDFKMPF
jgi:hypothetical protein